MQPTITKGIAPSAQQILDSLRAVIDRFETELQQQRDEIKVLRDERDEAKAMVKALKELFSDLKEWEHHDPAEYTVTIDDIIADIRSR